MTDHTDTQTRPEKQIPVDLSQPLVLEIHNPNGDVTVRATDRHDVLISHSTPGFAADDDGAELAIDVHGNHIEVRPSLRFGGGWTGEIDLDAVVGQITKAFRWGGPWSAAKPGKLRVGAGGPMWSDIIVEIPRAITGRVEIHTASGDARVESVSGEIALNSMSGDMRVVRTQGDIVLQTASGDLSVDGASGHLTVRTASGDVSVTSVQSDGFEIQSASGDVSLDALLTGERSYRIQTASGDVSLTLRRPTAAGEEPAATLAFQTVSGDAHVRPPFRKTDRRLWQAGAVGSGPRIEVTTVSGDLSAGIAADRAFIPAPSPTPPADGVPPVPPAPPALEIVPAPPSPLEPAPPTASWPRGELDPADTAATPEAVPQATHGDADRLAVLAAVERGEIDIEEALRRLEAADAFTSP